MSVETVKMYVWSLELRRRAIMLRNEADVLEFEAENLSSLACFTERMEFSLALCGKRPTVGGGDK